MRGLAVQFQREHQGGAGASLGLDRMDTWVTFFIRISAISGSRVVSCPTS